ncbi:hypothetical protein [Promicromonospora sp. NPDC050249]|uniref:hypothetical protein n=1 Tax=Promicromonospora sp. NPDC050249 TaxID=3154743 RepID=UPI0033F62CFF
MTRATETPATEAARRWPTTAYKSAGPITLGLGGLILGAGLFSIGSTASIIGIAAFLVGLVVFLDGVHKLVKNVDAATQALLDRRSSPPA